MEAFDAVLGAVRSILRRSGNLPADPRHAMGRRGERDAARHLRRNGYRIVGRNIRTPFGEVDLLCFDRKSGVHVIVEVKSSGSSQQAARGIARIGVEQRQRLLRVARYLGAKRGVEGVRIDLIKVSYRDGASRPTIEHHRGVVRR